MKLSCSINTQGRLVFPKIVRDAVGLEVGGRCIIEWDVDENDNAVAVIRPYRIACELCGNQHDLSIVGDTGLKVFASCKTQIKAMFGE